MLADHHPGPDEVVLPQASLVAGPDAGAAEDAEAAEPEYGALCEDKEDGTIAHDTVGEVDPTKVGEYKLVYKCQDSAGNTATQVSRIVKVKDRLKILANHLVVKPSVSSGGPAFAGLSSSLLRVWQPGA